MSFRLAPGEVLFSSCDGIGNPYNAEDRDKPWRYDKNIQVCPITDSGLIEQDPNLASKYDECRLKLLSVAKWIREQMFEKCEAIRYKYIEKVRR